MVYITKTILDSNRTKYCISEIWRGVTIHIATGQSMSCSNMTIQYLIVTRQYMIANGQYST